MKLTVFLQSFGLAWVRRGLGVDFVSREVDSLGEGHDWDAIPDCYSVRRLALRSNSTVNCIESWNERPRETVEL